MGPITLNVRVDNRLEYKIARLHPDVMKALGVEAGNAILLERGDRRAALLAWTAEPGSERDAVHVDSFIARVLELGEGEEVRVSKAYPSAARRVVLAPLSMRPPPPSEKSLSELLREKPLALGEVLGSPRVPRARLQVVSVEPLADTVTVDRGTRVEVSKSLVARRVVATGKPSPWSLACRGERLGSGLVLGVEPGPCAWVTPSTRVTVLDRERLLELVARSGLVERLLESLEAGEELTLHQLLLLLLLRELLD